MAGNDEDFLQMRQVRDQRIGEAIREIILAFSPNVHGETTMLYLAKLLSAKGGSASGVKNLHRRITRLARGLPLGADLEFADEVTLGESLSGRREL